MTPASSHRHAVLLVDDDDDLRAALGLLLEAEGFEQLQMDSAEAAFAKLACGYRPCVMLLDQRMPGMTGTEMLARLRARDDYAAIPVVLMSGDHDVVAARHAGAVDALEKPFDAPQMAAAIRAHARCEPASDPPRPSAPSRRTRDRIDPLYVRVVEARETLHARVEAARVLQAHHRELRERCRVSMSRLARYETLRPLDRADFGDRAR
jgi:FixJ family two-component response regulator